MSAIHAPMFSGPLNDPYWSNVVVLAHMDGANGSTTFTNEKTTLLTANAGLPTISTSVYKYGGSSGYFNDPSAKLIIQNTSDINLGTGDFCIEGWVYANAPSSDTIAIVGSNYYEDQFGLVSNTVYFGKIIGGYIAQTTTGLVSSNTWTHLALVRSGTTVTIFVNGIASATGSYPTSYTLGGKYFGNGGNDNPYQYIRGYLDELRVTKGVARYTSNFTPPTAPFPNN